MFNCQLQHRYITYSITMYISELFEKYIHFVGKCAEIEKYERRRAKQG